MFNLNIDFRIFWGLINLQISLGNQKKRNSKKNKNRKKASAISWLDVVHKVATTAAAAVVLFNFLTLDSWNKMICWVELIKNLF